MTNAITRTAATRTTHFRMAHPSLYDPGPASFLAAGRDQTANVPAAARLLDSPTANVQIERAEITQR